MAAYKNSKKLIVKKMDHDTFISVMSHRFSKNKVVEIMNDAINGNGFIRNNVIVMYDKIDSNFIVMYNEVRRLSMSSTDAIKATKYRFSDGKYFTENELDLIDEAIATGGALNDLLLKCVAELINR